MRRRRWKPEQKALIVLEGWSRFPASGRRGRSCHLPPTQCRCWSPVRPFDRDVNPCRGMLPRGSGRQTPRLLLQSIRQRAWKVK